jgi:hypothetical protein
MMRARVSHDFDYIQAIVAVKGVQGQGTGQSMRKMMQETTSLARLQFQDKSSHSKMP